MYHPNFQQILPYVEADRNFVISPFALGALLGLARCGANDETAQEIKMALKFPHNPKEIETVINHLYPNLKKGKNFTYDSALGLFMNSKSSIKKEFWKFASDVYKVDLEHIDFHNASTRTNIINEYVKSRCDGKIESVVEKNDIEGNSKLVLICVTFFKINWLKAFQKGASSTRKFIISPSKTVQATFMEKTGFYNYFESSDLKATFVSMPLEVKFLDLILVMPNDPSGFANLEMKIKDVFTEIKFTEERVHIVLPKIKIDFKIDLKKSMQRLGMMKCFTEDADFNGIIAQKDLLFINNIFHKVVVMFQEDDETPTNSMKAIGSAKQMSMAFKPFIADHPFIFYVRSEDVIVFAGRIKNPA